MVRNWYGCYHPKGRMCISSHRSEENVRKAAKRMGKGVDAFYAKEFRDSYHPGGDDELREVIEDNSSIVFCSGCHFADNFEGCKEYRKLRNRKVFR